MKTDSRFLPILASVFCLFGAYGLVMASTTSPFMGMEVPEVGDSGPTYAENIIEAFEIIDAHDHTDGNGTQVPTAGININADLPMGPNDAGANDLIRARTVRFTTSALVVGASDRRALYQCGGELCYVDEAANITTITNNGAVNGTPGSITGMTGSAGVAYSALTNTFAFTADDGTPALGDYSTVRIAENVVGGKGPRLKSNAATAADFDWIFPAALPGANRLLCLDAAGDVSTCTASAAAQALVIATSTSSATMSTTADASVGDELRVYGGSYGTASTTGGDTRAAQTTSTTSTSPGAVAGLTFNAADLQANTVYAIDCTLAAQGAATTTGIQPGIDVSAAVTNIQIECGAWDAASLYTRTSFSSDDGACAMAENPTAGSGQTRIEMSGIIEMGSPAASVTVRLRSEVGGSNVTVFGGSSCTLIPES